MWKHSRIGNASADELSGFSINISLSTCPDETALYHEARRAARKNEPIWPLATRRNAGRDLLQVDEKSTRTSVTDASNTARDRYSDRIAHV
jgi:hypothetical protein